MCQNIINLEMLLTIQSSERMQPFCSKFSPYVTALFKSLLHTVSIFSNNSKFSPYVPVLVTPFYFRNTKSSQEVVDFVGRRLREGVREKETQSLGSLLETVCEEVSWGGVGWCSKNAGHAHMQ